MTKAVLKTSPFARARNAAGTLLPHAEAYREGLLRLILDTEGVRQKSTGDAEIKEKPLDDLFVEMAAAKKNPIVWEIGTRRSVPERSTMHKEWVPHAKQFLGIDVRPGLDVDIVADVHHLDVDTSIIRAIASKMTERPDILISCSTFEHLDRPWIAAQAIGRAMNKGGVIFVQTHQSFPLHAYPNDMWRYTTESLSMIFKDAGFHIVDCSYQYPCLVVSRQDPQGYLFPSFLNVNLIGRKS